MALADHLQEESNRIYEAFLEIVHSPFVPDGGIHIIANRSVNFSASIESW